MQITILIKFPRQHTSQRIALLIRINLLGFARSRCALRMSVTQAIKEHLKCNESIKRALKEHLKSI